jgi:alcohol dehydrogenase (cytochrome c)
MTVATAPVEYKAGEHELGGTIRPDSTASGWVVAVDSETGVVRWRFHAEKPVIAGITPTAGGVLFTGDTAGHLLVLNSKTGLVLKQLDTGGALAGGVVTYEISGRQYVAFASGNVSRVTFGELGLPSVIIMALGGKNPVPGPVPQQGGVVATPNADRGHALFAQVCSTCHGAGGNLIEGHNLATLRDRRNLESTVAFIKAPVPPMPKLYPLTLTEQDVADLAAYLQQGGWK